MGPGRSDAHRTLPVSGSWSCVREEREHCLLHHQYHYGPSSFQSSCSRADSWQWFMHVHDQPTCFQGMALGIRGCEVREDFRRALPSTDQGNRWTWFAAHPTITISSSEASNTTASVPQTTPRVACLLMLQNETAASPVNGNTYTKTWRASVDRCRAFGAGDPQPCRGCTGVLYCSHSEGMKPRRSSS